MTPKSWQPRSSCGSMALWVQHEQRAGLCGATVHAMGLGLFVSAELVPGLSCSSAAWQCNKTADCTPPSLRLCVPGVTAASGCSAAPSHGYWGPSGPTAPETPGE